MAKKKPIRYPCTRQLPGGLWQYRKQIHKGRPDACELTGGPFESSEAAWLALQEAMALYRAGGLPAVEAARPVPTLGDLAEVWLSRVVATTCKPSTQSDYRLILDKHLLPVLGPQPVDQITRFMVKDFLLGKIADGYAASSVTHMKNAVSGILALAVDDNLLPANPALALGRLWKEKPRGADVNPFSADELRRLLSWLRENQAWYYPMVATLALAGLRAGEACGLHWQDVDLEGGTIYVRRSLSRMVMMDTPKSGKARQVDLAGPLAAILREHQIAMKRETLARGWGRPPALLFVNRAGRPVDINHFRSRTWAPALAAAGLPPRRVHDLRHTYITLRLAAGDNLLDVSAQAGHHSAKFTSDVYFHWTPSARAKAQVDALAERLGLGG